MSLFHSDHPWIGWDVEDGVTGRRGILRAIAPDGDSLRPAAWLLPHGGGIEWTTDPAALANPVPPAPDARPAP
ncbi:hypothetical protein [Streptomyces sp. NPDC047968]|uniref:hypothetical protein n=1 Tax=unclassified Streptomyces TaxID=2593676 RepID=UPI00343C157B